MDDIEKTLYKEAKKIIITLQSQIDCLEKDKSVVLQSKISYNTNALSNTVNKLQAILNHLPTSKRDIWSIKIEQLVAENKKIRDEIQSYFYDIHAQTKQDEIMQDLHQRRTQAQHQMYAQNINQAERDTGASISRSQQVANEMLEMIGTVKMAVFDQNSQLKRIRKRVRDVMGQFELSRSLLNMIERRSRVDQLIMFAGMFLIVLFVFIWWFWFKGSSNHIYPSHEHVSHEHASI